MSKQIYYFALSQGSLRDVGKIPLNHQVVYLEAYRSELANMINKEIFEPSALPEGHVPIDSFVFFTDKTMADGSYDKTKCRLVARGDKQRPWQYSDLFASVLAPEHFRLFVAWCAHHRVAPSAVDVEAAFLQVPLAEELYLRCDRQMLSHLPQIMRKRMQAISGSGGHAVLRLRRTLYGLRQGPANFQKSLFSTL